MRFPWPLSEIDSNLMSKLQSSAIFFFTLFLLQSVVSHAQTSPTGAVQAATSAPENWNAKFQSTYIWQEKLRSSAKYDGPNSLSIEQKRSFSFTATAALGARLWEGGEMYFNPEVAAGIPLSHLTGLGGFTNGELARVSGPDPKLYLARLFLRQTWNLGGEKIKTDSAANQLADEIDKRRIVLTIGHLSPLDLFDNNSYSHDPRTQFLNWSLMTHGAYDYAANARGYSSGAALEYFHDNWEIRAARFLEPTESNGSHLDWKPFTHYGDQLELAHAHQINEYSGKLRLLLYRNVAEMGSYKAALDAAANAPPDLAQTRKRRIKHGAGVSLEQEIDEGVGIFGRASLNSGDQETYAFTEIDQSAAAGISFKGSLWERPGDTVGAAWIINGLSASHRKYLANGGIGYFLGDGALNYQPEQITEMYYSLNCRKNLWLSFDYQFIRNPGYNADRGPAMIGSLRLHAEL